LKSHLFTKADRILKRSEFIFLSKYGKKIHNKYFIAVISRGKTGRIRLGITVTKKVGNAVVRNRLKRLIREYFRLNRDNISRNWDINLIAKKEASELSANLINSSLHTLFKKIGKESC
jgi:ribonuclease P protein component